MHSLLKRQLRRYFGNSNPEIKNIQGFLDLVNNAYLQFDSDRTMLERSLELSSEELLESNSDFRAVFERIVASSSDGIFSFDNQLICTVWNAGMERITGIPAEKALQQDIIRVVPSLEASGDDAFLRDSLSGKSVLGRETRLVVKQTGEKGFFESHFLPLKNEDGEIVGGLAIFRDITGRKVAEQALAEQAIRDTLTNLYNRRYFNYRLPEIISRAGRDNTSMAILMCDLDFFKKINDSQGHHFGDKVLTVVAKSIQNSVRGIDLVFRWGGDEFVVVISSKTRRGFITLADRIRDGIKKIAVEFHCELDVTIGVSIFPDNGRNPEEMIRSADRALYIAKQQGHKLHIGDEDYRLDEKSFDVAFQPIFDVNTDEIIGQEALTRDSAGELTVEEIFKKHETVGQLGEMKHLCFTKQLAMAQDLGFKKVFLNVDYDLLDRLGDLKKPSGIDVFLEISEKEALYDVDHYLKITRDWRARGFKVAIDDFGAGFISLPFLAKLVPDYIKMDRSTILHAVASKKFRGFLQYLVFAMQDYSKEGVIAEGVEKKVELKVVKEMGIHLAQGFLLGKPKIYPGTEGLR